MTNKKPADGERVARIGYEAQDKRAAHLIYNILLEGRLDWFRIADPEAGRVDDIQVATVDGDLHAYQVKWAETTTTISFAEFIHSGSGDDPSLITQLADGWQQLGQTHPDKHVYVYLIHRHIPAPKSPLQDSRIILPLDNPPPLQSNFQAFIRDCFQNKNWLSSGLDEIPTGWRAAIEALKQATGLSDDKDFLTFLKAVSLHFNYQFPEQENPPNRNANRREKDVDQLARLIAKLGGGAKRIIQVNRADLLRELGWASRFEFRFKHEFKVDETLYQPISQTVEELEAAIAKYTSGYLAIIGTPGSGKSTTLTQTLRYRQGLRIIRYYAYVPDSSWQEARGEADSFLHDLHLALQRQGIYARSENGSQPETIDELREALKAQFQELHRRWQEEQIRTLIIIDGLDHIEREQSPQHSLLKELPLPNGIPEGVLLLLGSQTLSLDNLHQRIADHLKESGRTLKIHALSRPAVFNIIAASPLLVDLSHAQQDTVLSLSNGHPLALSYLLANLCNAADTEDIDEILGSTTPYQRHIEENYRIYWDQLTHHSELKELLALLSRLRGPFNPEELLCWTNESAVALFLERAKHYFHQESDTRWLFFHNSFRQFILGQTRLNVFGKFDETKDKAFHRKLADFAAEAPQNSPWSWEELYHRFSAQDWEQVLVIGSQAYFRQQFFNLRPLAAIREDIALCLKTTRHQRDGVAIIRMFLIEKELTDRQEVINLGGFDLPALLYELKGLDSAMNFVMDGRQLRISDKKALKFAAFLYDKGQLQAAESIFNAAEPLGLLSGSESIESNGDDADTVYAWAEIAHVFRPLEKLLTVIEQLRADTSHAWESQNPEKWHRNIRNNVLSALVDAVFNSGDEVKLSRLKVLLLQRQDGNNWLRKLDFAECFSRRNPDSAEIALNRLLERCERKQPNTHTLLKLAEFCFRIRGDKDKAEKLIAEIPQPELYEINREFGDWQDLTPFLYRIRLNRLLSMLGQAVDPTKAVPNDEPRRKGAVLFERCLVIIANLWGRAWADNFCLPTIILYELRPAFALFSRNWSETNDWTSWYSYRKSASDFYIFLIQAVATHGFEALQAVSDEFDRCWETKPNYWPVAWRRDITMSLYRQGGSKDELIHRLEKIEAGLSESDDVQTRLFELSKQAEAWLEAGQPEKAQKLFPQLFQHSFGIWYDKDDQVSDWFGWLAKITAKMPDSTEEDIRRFAAALVTLENTGRGRDIQEAAAELITLTAKWNPAYALQLKDWLLANHAIHYTSILEGILTAALSQDVPIELVFTFTCHLLIPFARTAPEHLPKLLAEQCVLKCSSSESQVLLERLEKALETKAFPSTRADWWRGIAEGLQAAKADSGYFYSKLKQETGEKLSESDTDVVLSSGEKMTHRDALLRITTGQSLLNFVDQIENARYFHWDEAVSKVVDSLTYIQIQALSQKLVRFSYRPGVDALLAQRLKALGHTEEGRGLLETLLDRSAPQGWNKYYDGGSRLFAVQAWVTFDPEQGRAIIYDKLVNDYLSNMLHRSSMVANLESILPLLFEQIPLLVIWQEIREHAYQLNEFSQTDALPPSDETSSTSWQAVLLRLLTDTAKIEIAEIREEAHRALCKICFNRTYDSDSTILLREMLNSDETQAYQALAVLESMLGMRPEKIAAFADEILSLCISHNMTIRSMATGLALAIGHPVESPVHRPLATTYMLKLAGFKIQDAAVPFDALPPGGSFPDSHDPLERIRPFEMEFKLLGEASGIPWQNLVYRAAGLMSSLTLEELWNKQAEEKMKAWLNAAELKLTYHRLRPQQALRALNHVATELADAGKLDNNALAFIEHWLARHDYIMSNLEPEPRPAEVVFPEGHLSSFDRDKNWVHNGEEAFSLMPERFRDDRIVLAELTRIRDLDWETPTEYRFCMIAHPKWPLSTDLHNASNFFPYENDWYAMDYPDLQNTEAPAAVVYGNPRSVEPGSQEWLAFNPALAHQLGWKLSRNGLFRWLDSQGQTMVESLCWQDGSIHRLPPRREVCGEGWLVLACQEAVDIMLGTVGQATRLNTVIREIHNSKEEQSARHSSIRRTNL